MRILVSWLRELVDVPVTIPELARALHMTGFEVASVEPPPGAASVADDAVVDFEITANRPDCLSVIGIAREVATLHDLPLRPLLTADIGTGSPREAAGLRVTIEDPGRCPRYCGALAAVRVGPSPGWMQARLAAAGIRAINNIVDITNYVLIELGHPMHAFDLERLGGRELRVRLARPGERVRTLDGQTRDLAPDMLVIADAERAQAVAGVMGGADSEVSEGTSIIALESAWFEPTGIRRTGRRLGLSTEASYRFERGADLAAPPVALARALALLEQVGAMRPADGTAEAGPGGWIDAFPARREPRVVDLPLARVPQVLGEPVPAEAITRILANLGFGVTHEGEVLRATVPSWRVDVARDVDLIEEVARHRGYDKLPTTFPALAETPPAPRPRLERDRAARRAAAAAGFSEAVTFSFIERAAAAAFAPEAETVAILNPLSEQFAVLRPSLLPGLLEAVAHNRRRGISDVRLVEVGTCFTAAGGEHRSLGLAWMGAAAGQHWSGSGRRVDFFDMSGAVEAIAGALGVGVRFVAAERGFLARGRTAAVEARTPDGLWRPAGVAGQLLPALATVRDIPAHDEVYVAEIDLDALEDLVTLGEPAEATPPPRHPAVMRDISIVVDNALPAATVRGTIRAAAPPTLVRVVEFDRYQGTGVPEGRVSLSYRLTFQAADRTLTDAEVQQAMDAVLQGLAAAHGAVQR